MCSHGARVCLEKARSEPPDTIGSAGVRAAGGFAARAVGAGAAAMISFVGKHFLLL